MVQLEQCSYHLAFVVLGAGSAAHIAKAPIVTLFICLVQSSQTYATNVVNLRSDVFRLLYLLLLKFYFLTLS